MDPHIKKIAHLVRFFFVFRYVWNPKKETNKGNQFNNPIKGCVFKSPPSESRDVFFRGKIRQETIIRRLIKISDKFILSLSGFSF